MSPLTVLYVEDDPNNRMLIRRILMAEGYNMLDAASAEEALAVVALNRPDLVLMDINMPDVDGLTLTSQLKKLPLMANVPIVAVTANVMRGDRERTLAAGCDGYLQKPIDVDALPRQVSQFIQEARRG
jgi:two-component system cell cycle response regulator DivK